MEACDCMTDDKLLELNAVGSDCGGFSARSLFMAGAEYPEAARSARPAEVVPRRSAPHRVPRPSLDDQLVFVEGYASGKSRGIEIHLDGSGSLRERTR